jgi:hypothetical protein
MGLSKAVAEAQRERLTTLPYYPDTKLTEREILLLFQEICTPDVKAFRKAVPPDEQCKMLVDLVLRRETRWNGLASLRQAHKDLFPQYPDFE